jgi:hypothetical protein
MDLLQAPEVDGDIDLDRRIRRRFWKRESTHDGVPGHLRVALGPAR